MSQFRVGYIDEDKGQTNLFHHTFKSSFDITLLPIDKEITVDALVDHVLELNLDLLVLDFRLDESGVVDFNANAIVDSVRQRNIHFPLIVLTSYEVDALDHLTDATLVDGKDEAFGDKHEVFSTKVLKMAEGYKQECLDSIETLKSLTLKMKTQGLEVNEEEQYLRVNRFMEEVSCANSQIASSFFSVATNKRLDTLIAKADQMLEKLS